MAGHDDNVPYAVDSRRSGDGLEVLARTRLPSLIRDLGTDDTRIYAATDHEVVVLETACLPVSNRRGSRGWPSGRTGCI